MNSCCGKIYIVIIYWSWFFLNYLFTLYLFTLYQTWSSYLLYCLMHAFYLFYFSKYRDIILIVIPLFTCLTCYLTSCTRTVNIKYRCDRRWTTNVLVYLIIIFMLWCQHESIPILLTENASKERRIVSLSKECRRGKRIPRTSQSVCNQQ